VSDVLPQLGLVGALVLLNATHRDSHDGPLGVVPGDLSLMAWA
jgi:hypothetical protein